MEHFDICTLFQEKTKDEVAFFCPGEIKNTKQNRQVNETFSKKHLKLAQKVRCH